MAHHGADGASEEEREAPIWRKKFAEDMIASLENSKYNHQNTDPNKLSSTGRHIVNTQESGCFYELKLNSPHKEQTNK